MLQTCYGSSVGVEGKVKIDWLINYKHGLRKIFFLSYFPMRKIKRFCYAKAYSVSVNTLLKSDLFISMIWTFWRMLLVSMPVRHWGMKWLVVQLWIWEGYELRGFVHNNFPLRHKQSLLNNYYFCNTWILGSTMVYWRPQFPWFLFLMPSFLLIILYCWILCDGVQYVIHIICSVLRL